jgi:hypothetical protein
MFRKRTYFVTLPTIMVLPMRTMGILKQWTLACELHGFNLLNSVNPVFFLPTGNITRVGSYPKDATTSAKIAGAIGSAGLTGGSSENRGGITALPLALLPSPPQRYAHSLLGILAGSYL